MNMDYKIENGCSSTEDFMKRVAVKQSGNLLFRTPHEGGFEKGGFYLEIAGFTDPKPGYDSFTVALCHEDCTEKVTAFTIRPAGKFHYSSIEEIKFREIRIIAALNFLLDYSWMAEEYAREFLNIRESMSDIAMYVRKGTYKDTPLELKPFQYWLAGYGNVIMAVPECSLEEANGDLYMHEVCIPCTYVLELGYRFHKGYVVVDAYYDPVYGLDVPDGYNC